MPASSLLRDNGLRIGLVIGVSGPGGCWPRLARGPTSSPNPVGAGLLSFLQLHGNRRLHGDWRGPHAEAARA